MSAPPAHPRARARARERALARAAERALTYQQAVTEVVAADERREPWEVRHRLRVAMWEAHSRLQAAQREAGA